MEQERAIYEPATETAKKIRKAFKAAYPGSKFSVKSSNGTMTSSVRIYWTGGIEPDHDDCHDLARSFKSTNFDGMTDYADVVGYRWDYDGKLYSGADYVFYSRS